MKYFLALILLSLISSSAFSKIISSKGKFYILGQGSKNPIFMVNKLAQEQVISQVKLYKGGEVHIISYAKKGEKEKLYSVDDKGYVYSINPFSEYSVTSIDTDGHIRFKEDPRRKYFISSKGYFLY